jgi:DNA-binding NtrC family response regulator
MDTTQPPATIVILEDEALIAVDLEDQLRSAGFDVAALFSSCAAAMEWLECRSPDLAILDIDLQDGNCSAIARLLHERQVPFIVHSGSAAVADHHDPIFKQATWVAKPAHPDHMQEAVAGALAKTRQKQANAEAGRHIG